MPHTTKRQRPAARLVSIPDAAATLGVSDRFLIELCLRGRLPHVRLGAKRMVKRETIDEIVEGRLDLGPEPTA